MELPSNTLLQSGKYKIIKKIGQGGFGIAYKAYQQGLQRDVCIKEFFFYDLCERALNSPDITILSTLPEKIQLITTFKRKFLKEAQRLAQFKHTNIVQVIDVFEENKTAYFVMEYLEGGSLEDLLVHDGAMTEQKTKETILPIINAMETIHKADLLHLDIKPANIMLRRDQTPVLIDFGISKYMEIAAGYTTTAPVGISKGYAPLEQYGGNIADLTKATDIYSICATIYRMVTGVIPPEPLQLIGSKLQSPCEFNSKLSIEFVDTIIKGLSMFAYDRQQTINELIEVFGSKNRIINSRSIETEHCIIKLERKYSVLRPFSEGLAGVCFEGKWGFIDKKGEEVIPCKYYDFTPFKDGLAMGLFNLTNRPNHDGKWCILDNTGKELTPYGLYFYECEKLIKEGLIKVQLNERWGFFDKTGQEVILVKYDYADNFSEGLAEVMLNKKWGFINTTGLEIVSCIYDFVTSFYEGVANVKLHEKWGLINKKGQEIIPCKFDEIKRFFEGLAPVRLNGKWGLINNDGKEILPCIYDTLCNRNFGEYELEMEGIVKVVILHGSVKIQSNNGWGFIDKSGKEVIPCIYVDVSFFSEGVASVKLDDKWGFIDKNGKEIIPCIYADAWSFSEDVAKVKLRDKWGFINKAGREIIPCMYDNVHNLRNGLFEVELNEKLGIVDKMGQEITPCKYDSISTFYSGWIEFELNGEKGIIDKSGQEVSLSKYDSYFLFSDKNFVKVELNGKVGLMDDNGILIIPCSYEDICFTEFDYIDENLWTHHDYKAFNEDLARVKLNGKWGFVDKTGNLLIKCEYHNAWGFSEGLALVELNGNWFYIDKKGNVVLSDKVNTVGFKEFTNDLAKTEFNGKWGILDKTGKEITPYKYDSIFDFSNGLAEVKLNNKWGLIDNSGNEVVPCKYNEIARLFENFIAVSINNNWGLFDIKGIEILPCLYDYIDCHNHALVSSEEFF